MKKYRILHNVSHGYRDKDGSLKRVYLTKGQILSALPPSLDKKHYEIIEEQEETKGEKKTTKKKTTKRKGGKKK